MGDSLLKFRRRLSARPSPSPWDPRRSAIHTRSSHSTYAGRTVGYGSSCNQSYYSALVSSRVDRRHPAGQAVGSFGITACPGRNSQGTAFDWSKQDTNSCPPAKLSSVALHRPWFLQGLGGAGAMAIHLGLFCSAAHSMEPIAQVVWTGCGLRRCSTSSAPRR